MRLPHRIPRLFPLEVSTPGAAATQKNRYEVKLRDIATNSPVDRMRRSFSSFPPPAGPKSAAPHGPQSWNVLAAAISLDTVAAAAPRRDSRVRVVSEGFRAFELDLADLAAHPEERGSSAAIVRGMAAGIADFARSAARRGSAPSPLRGFDAFVQSEVLPGSGLSSSAAFELLIGGIIATFSGIGISPMEIASIGQFSENVYFGKPCGLMDQMACALGNIALIIAATPRKRGWNSCDPPGDYGLSLVIVSSGGSMTTSPRTAHFPRVEGGSRLFWQVSLSGLT